MARKEAPVEVLVCNTTFAGQTPDGVDVSVSSGQRVRSDNPLVKHWPDFFSRDGVLDHELVADRYRVEDASRAAHASAPDRTMECIEEIYDLKSPSNPYSQTWGQVSPGGRLHESHDLVQRYPKSWKVVEE
jgi:hypothetical protein